jgi:hypothetical protein
LSCVMSVRRAQCHIQRMTVSINHQVAFESFYAVLSRISDLFICPLFDLITLAS